MYATAEQATEGLRHRGTGELLPTKLIDRNTRLVFYDEEMVALRFHKTDIAIYTPNGVVIDTRGNPAGEQSPHREGWFTMTTWQRIDSYTPVRTHTEKGVRYVNGRLYTHGMAIDPNGEIVSPIERALEDALLRVLRTYPQRLKRHADKTAAAWQSWGYPLECCCDAANDNAWVIHYLGHIEAKDYAVPYHADRIVANLRSEGHYGERLVAALATRLRAEFKPMLRHAVKRVYPEFPYPQLTKGRTRT